MAIENMGVSKNEAVMNGDDIESDIKGAKDFGIKTIQVKTGKYQETDSRPAQQYGRDLHGIPAPCRAVSGEQERVAAAAAAQGADKAGRDRRGGGETICLVERDAV